MRSAREIAVEAMADDEFAGSETIASCIQQAREDGARWERQRVLREIDNDPTAPPSLVRSRIISVSVVDVKDVAP